jgi:hypothetical protein
LPRLGSADPDAITDEAGFGALALAAFFSGDG